ncbi:MAG: FtsX-like permease family protein, partial [Chloroflexi bacterium]|nr:FtsX-like permease family protein [Chloroflexota bacterium]
MSIPAFFPAGLRRVAWRTLRSHVWQNLLVIVGITIGVAVVVSIDLANASAQQAFELSTQTITGKATHQIYGSTGPLDESVYVNLVRHGLAVQAAPVVSEYVSAPGLGGRTFQLLGIDPFVDATFRSYLGSQDMPDLAPLVALLTRPGAVLLSAELADGYGLQPGQEFDIEMAGRTQTVFVAGLLHPADRLSQRALDGLILADIATAQELTGRLGQLDRIDLILPPDQPELAQELQSELPPTVYLAPAAARQGAVEQMTAAFRLNLTALSLLALVVGLFLIYNTMTFSVVQRRPLFGIMRCLGVTRRELFVMVISEAAVMGAIGSLLGIGLGVLMGRQTVAMVTQTINDLYFTTTVQAVGVPTQSLIKGGVLGVAASVLAAAVPAREAATVPPRLTLLRSDLEYKVRRRVPWGSLAGLALIA